MMQQYLLDSIENETINNEIETSFMMMEYYLKKAEMETYSNDTVYQEARSLKEMWDSDTSAIHGREGEGAFMRVIKFLPRLIRNIIKWIANAIRDLFNKNKKDKKAIETIANSNVSEEEFTQALEEAAAAGEAELAAAGIDTPKAEYESEPEPTTPEESKTDKPESEDKDVSGISNETKKRVEIKARNKDKPESEDKDVSGISNETKKRVEIKARNKDKPESEDKDVSGISNETKKRVEIKDSYHKSRDEAIEFLAHIRVFITRNPNITASNVYSEMFIKKKVYSSFDFDYIGNIIEIIKKAMQDFDDINNEIGKKDIMSADKKIIYKKLSILNKKLTSFNQIGMKINVTDLDSVPQPHWRYVKDNQKLNGVYFYEQSKYDHFVNVYMKELDSFNKNLDKMLDAFEGIGRDNKSNVGKLYEMNKKSIFKYDSELRNVDDEKGNTDAYKIKKKRIEMDKKKAEELDSCIRELTRSLNYTITCVKLIKALHDKNVKDHFKLANWCSGYKATTKANKIYANELGIKAWNAKFLK